MWYNIIVARRTEGREEVRGKREEVRSEERMNPFPTWGCGREKTWGCSHEQPHARESKKPPIVKKQDYIMASDKAFSVAVPGALLGANACVAHRPLPLAQLPPRRRLYLIHRKRSPFPTGEGLAMT